MATELSNFKRSKKFLLCVDSDGCAMDTMTVKHVKCFGPCFTEEWDIKDCREKILMRWNDINLYQRSRGINRFKGLAQILTELFPDNAGITEFKHWTDNAKELSEFSVNLAYEQTKNQIFKKALSWSKAVNIKINALANEEKLAFDGVRNALSLASRYCDIAIVSSANYAAVVEEWERCNLLENTNVITTQKDGSKAYCIEQLIKTGYDRDKVLMCGDAVGDFEAAKKNGIFFYPILAKKEINSWQQFSAVYFEKFIDGSYSASAYDLYDKFINNFS